MSGKRERQAVDVTTYGDAHRRYLGGSAIETHERYKGQAKILVGNVTLDADVTFHDWSDLIDCSDSSEPRRTRLVRGLRSWEGTYSIGSEALDDLPAAELLLPSGRRGKILITSSDGDGTGSFVGDGAPPEVPA